MKFLFDGKFWILFDDGIRYEVVEDLWDRLRKKSQREKMA